MRFASAKAKVVSGGEWIVLIRRPRIAERKSAKLLQRSADSATCYVRDNFVFESFAAFRIVPKHGN